LLSNSAVAHLRRFADDDTKSFAKRLTSVDLLAADAGLYFLRKTEHLYSESVSCGTRSRREIVRLLRRLLKSPSPETKRVNTAGIENRLRFIQTGISLGRDVYRLKPDSMTATPKSPVGFGDSLDEKLQQLERDFAEKNNESTNSI
jgi:hypothetical protein